MFWWVTTKLRLKIVCKGIPTRRIVAFLQLWPNCWWIKMPLSKDVGLSPGHIVLDGDPVWTQHPHSSPSPTFRPMSIVAKRSSISATAELLLDSGSLAWKCLLTPLLVVLGEYFPKMTSIIVLNPKDRPWPEPRHLIHKAWISASRFELGVGSRKKDSTGQDRKKLQKGYISRIWGEAPTDAIHIKNCVVGDVLGVPNFQGLRFTGSRIFYFPIDF